MTKREKIRALYMGLLYDKTFKPKDSNMGLMWLSFDGSYIHYRNYGQSAVKTSLKNLTWLCNEIFKTTDFIETTI